MTADAGSTRRIRIALLHVVASGYVEPGDNDRAAVVVMARAPVHHAALGARRVEELDDVARDRKAGPSSDLGLFPDKGGPHDKLHGPGSPHSRSLEGSSAGTASEAI
jgi:hypothetical protein